MGHFIFYPHSLAALPPPPYRRLSYVVFVVGTNIEDYIRGAQNVAGVLKKEKECLLLLIEGGRRGAVNLNVQFYFQPPSPTPTPHFLFRSAAAATKVYTERLHPGVKPLLCLRTPLWTETVLLCHKFY